MKAGVFVAHSDDEIIGCGGTLMKHIKVGDEVKIYIMAEGKSARKDSYEEPTRAELERYRHETLEAAAVMGITEDCVRFFDLPNCRLENMDLLDIIKLMEKVGEEEAFDIIYTHNINDLNVDHEAVARAVITAFRAVPGESVREILMFETLSSTEYSMPWSGRTFEPNLFVDISEFTERKIAAMSCYKSELRKAPHPRSLEMIECNARVWGSKVGVGAAEAFRAARIMR